MTVMLELPLFQNNHEFLIRSLTYCHTYINALAPPLPDYAVRQRGTTGREAVLRDEKENMSYLFGYSEIIRNFAAKQ